MKINTYDAIGIRDSLQDAIYEMSKDGTVADEDLARYERLFDIRNNNEFPLAAANGLHSRYQHECSKRGEKATRDGSPEIEVDENVVDELRALLGIEA